MWGKHARPGREVHGTGRVSGEHWEDSDSPWYLSYIRNPSLQGDSCGNFGNVVQRWRDPWGDSMGQPRRFCLLLERMGNIQVPCQAWP